MKLDELTIEELKADFFDETAIRARPRQLYRVDGGKHRYYWRFENANHLVFYPSVTSVISACTPTSPNIIDWIAMHGKERAEVLKNQAAEYGSIMHREFGRYLVAGTYDLQAIPSMLDTEQPRYMENPMAWADTLGTDLLSFQQWVTDYEVVPVFIELPLADDEMGVAGSVDLGCYQNAAKYTASTPPEKRQRIFSIVDFKSGRKGFYEGHKIQLHAYKRMAESQLGVQVDRVYNWGPKGLSSRTKTPGYSFTDQTHSDTKPEETLDLVLQLARRWVPRRPAPRLVLSGTLEPGRSATEFFTRQDIEEVLLEKFRNRYEPEPETMMVLDRPGSSDPGKDPEDDASQHPPKPPQGNGAQAPLNF